MSSLIHTLKSAGCLDPFPKAAMSCPSLEEMLECMKNADFGSLRLFWEIVDAL